MRLDLPRRALAADRLGTADLEWIGNATVLRCLGGFTAKPACTSGSAATSPATRSSSTGSRQDPIENFWARRAESDLAANLHAIERGRPVPFRLRG